MKLDAIASRGVKKDFYDFYFIAQLIALEDLLANSQEKYPTVRDFSLMVLEALLDFQVADQQTDLVTNPSVTWERVRQFVATEVKRIAGLWFDP